MRAPAYEQPLDEHLPHLVERLQQKRDRAPLVRRHDRPREGPQRPVGSPAVADTRRQLAVARRLEALYQQDFRRCREGYRPQDGALEAVDTLTSKLPFGRYAWVGEADITTCLDTLDQDWRVRMLAARSR